jgi:hypothetical protein
VIPPALRRLRLRAPAAALAAAVVLGGAAATAVALQDAPARKTVDDMDMGLLQRNLLKIYVCGKESTLSGKAIDQLKLAIEMEGFPGQSKLTQPTAEQMKTMEDRHKFIFNYMLVEKTNAVQMVHIIDRILGSDVHLEGEGRPERKILEKRIDLIEIPRGAGKGTEIREAGRILSEALGCPVRVETIDTQIYRLTLTMEKTTGEAVIKQICAYVPFNYHIVEGVVILRHRDLEGGAKKADPAPDLPDEEEEKGK